MTSEIVTGPDGTYTVLGRVITKKTAPHNNLELKTEQLSLLVSSDRFFITSIGPQTMTLDTAHWPRMHSHLRRAFRTIQELLVFAGQLAQAFERTHVVLFDKATIQIYEKAFPLFYVWLLLFGYDPFLDFGAVGDNMYTHLQRKHALRNLGVKYLSAFASDTSWKHALYERFSTPENEHVRMKTIVLDLPPPEQQAFFNIVEQAIPHPFMLAKRTAFPPAGLAMHEFLALPAGTYPLTFQGQTYRIEKDIDKDGVTYKLNEPPRVVLRIVKGDAVISGFQDGSDNESVLALLEALAKASGCFRIYLKNDDLTTTQYGKPMYQSLIDFVLHPSNKGFFERHGYEALHDLETAEDYDEYLTELRERHVFADKPITPPAEFAEAGHPYILFRDAWEHATRAETYAYLYELIQKDFEIPPVQLKLLTD